MKKIKKDKWTKEKLISLFKKLNSSDKQMTKEEWSAHPETPSDMPIRVLFKSWNNFIEACGGIPQKPFISKSARENSQKARVGQRSGNWKGGRLINRLGYVEVWKPDHPNCKSAGYILEHRLIMSELLGRPLQDNENVHHINGDRSDNRVENLELWNTSQPNGQRVEDKIKWAKEILKIYENFQTPELLEQ